ncbi:asialoglycoprotein receptor 2-like [Saccopteryx leptura]|uniref:asialoglycoprotein receptor 2-like n=1 Tax=Saccopteryx leptura TaxID=249018 RepID=UPI00339CAA1C
MAKDFQDIQHLDSEENDHLLGTPPSQPLRQQSLCSRLWLSLLVLGFSILLLMAICVIGSQRTQMQVELWTLKEAFSNFSSSTLTEIRALGSHGGSIGDSVTSLEARLEKQEDLKADHATLLFHLKHFPADLRILACQMAFLRSNGTECYPVNWLEHEGSCYWFSGSGLTWPEAEKYCQLVVINSREEQRPEADVWQNSRVHSGAATDPKKWEITARTRQRDRSQVSR